MNTVMLQQGDSLALMKRLPANSVDSIVTDPPYHLTAGKKGGTSAAGTGFMGTVWDGGDVAFRPEFWVQALRVAKPGAHLVAFGGSRTYHRMVCAIEDAGWEIRDGLGWLYGSGFPKSLNVSKAIDDAAGATRIPGPVDPSRAGRLVHQHDEYTTGPGWSAGNRKVTVDAPVTDAAKTWDGWGTALKPAWEPIVLARKPLTQTVAANVQQYGTGAMNIDGCRIKGGPVPINKLEAWSGFGEMERPAYTPTISTKGRWPANILWSHHPECVMTGTAPAKGKQLAAGCPGFGADRDDNYVLGTGAKHGPDEMTEMWTCHPDCPSQVFPDTGVSSGGGMKDLKKGSLFMGDTHPNITERCGLGDSGSTSRFFYCAKVSRREREAGCESLPARNAGEATGGRQEHSAGLNSPRAGASRMSRGTHNIHPTVKPLSLMRHLVRLVTPPNGVVLDPFMGSGSTGCACAGEGMRFIGIDLMPEHVEIAKARIAYWQTQDVCEKTLDTPSACALELD